MAQDGRLLDDAGQPLAGWGVEIVDFEGSGSDGATTGDDGRFRFEDVLDHAHQLGASKGLYSSLLVQGVRPSEDELALRVPRDRIPSVHIVGAFLDERGEPVRGATAMPWGDDNQSAPVKCDDVTGLFDVGPLPAGSSAARGTARSRRR